MKYFRQSQQDRRVIRQVRKREEEMVLRLLWSLECRNVETASHIRRMGLFSAALAEKVGWEVEEVNDIRVAAYMHDIGKVGIPASIWLKPGELTPAEFEIVKRHTEVGAMILEDSKFPLLQMARDIAWCHHERWDGSGYPRGLSGEEIPESARIVAVVDIYDALLHQRPYGPAMPEEEVLSTLRQAREKHFDPQILDCFLEIIPQLHAIERQVAAEGTLWMRRSRERF